MCLITVLRDCEKRLEKRWEIENNIPSEADTTLLVSPCYFSLTCDATEAFKQQCETMAMLSCCQIPSAAYEPVTKTALI